jgi:hypothetical protein
MKSSGRILASLWMAATLALRPPPVDAQDPEERDLRALVEQLDAEEPAQRDRAREQLTAKGRKILPLLKPFLKASSGEVAAQVRSIVERFEREELLERSLPPLRTVTIPKGSRTPEEIFRQVREQTGYRMVPYGMNLRSPVEAGWEKAPVLKVLDDLCLRMGQGRSEPPALNSRYSDEFGRFSDRSREPGSSDVLVVNGEAKLLPSTAHWNQFRAAVMDVVVTEQRSFQKSSTHAALHLTVAGQPGTQPIYVGSWEVQEVLDDRGVSLKEEGARQAAFREESLPALGESLDAVWFGGDRWSRYLGGHEEVSIQPPSPGARKIARLRLNLRVSFAYQEVMRTVTLDEVKDKGKGTLDFGVVGITVSQPEFKEGTFSLSYEVRGTCRGSPSLILLDKDKAEIRTRGGGSSSSGTSHQQKWYLQGSPEVSVIRASAWIGQKTIDIPFEFSDIPVPGEK